MTSIGSVRVTCAIGISAITFTARDGIRAALRLLVGKQPNISLTEEESRTAMTNNISTIELAQLDTVTGGADGKQIYETIGNWVGGIAGGAGGAAGGAALAAPLSPVGQAAAAGAGGVAGERVGSAAGGAVGRGLWNAGSWIGDRIGNALYPSK